MFAPFQHNKKMSSETPFSGSGWKHPLPDDLLCTTPLREGDALERQISLASSRPASAFTTKKSESLVVSRLKKKHT